MEIHPLYGPVVPEHGWVPAPRYLLRRDRVLKLIGSMPHGSALEIGCGAGTLLYELGALGWQCEAVDTSEKASAIASEINSRYQSFNVSPAFDSSHFGKFDLLLAFEVLEHIEDDLGALTEWRKALRSDGRVLVSVPAHQRLWNPSDVWAGHFRRYSRDDVLSLLERAGFQVETIECYGFPLANVLERVRGYIHGRDLKRTNAKGMQDRSNRSGVERSVESRLYPLQAGWIGRQIMKAAISLQSRTVATNWGTGYLALGKISQ